MNHKNPFSFKELSINDPFCDREKELADLLSYAKGNANVVLYSPRRFGKTSLVKRVQAKLAATGTIPIFIDFFGIASVTELALRFAKAIFTVTRANESFFKTALRFLKSFRPVLKPDETGGISLSVESVASAKSDREILEEALTSLEQLAKDHKTKLHIVLDEFQEVVELKESAQIEGMFRSHIQQHPFSYFFVGSRRHLLLAMFNERKRPFFQSAINYELKGLPHEDLVIFLVLLFKQGGKICSTALAQSISEQVDQHPYYAQKLSFFIYELSGKTIHEQDIQSGYTSLLSSEKPVFEALLQGLAPKQIGLLQAIAREPSRSLFSIDYMKRHNLSSTGAMQGALQRLSALDLIEKNKQGVWKIVDPLFGRWLIQ